MNDSRTAIFNDCRLKDVEFSYGLTPCLTDLSLSIDSGIFYGLIGPNGSGKSTLIDLISGYLKPLNGTVELNGRPLDSYQKGELARLLTLVPQSFTFNFDFTVYDTVMMGRYPHIPKFSSPDHIDHQKVEQSLDLLSVDHLAERSIRKLSGGETQRVMIARALAQDSDFVLLDEVTANLDVSHAIAIMQTMKQLVAAGKTVIAALHDLNVALAFCDRVIVLSEGRLHQVGEAHQVINEQLVADIYQVTCSLMTSDRGSTHLSYNYQ